MRTPLDWLREPDSHTNAVGQYVGPPVPGETYFRWVRWRGSVKRIADLALVIGELLGDDHPVVAVYWSGEFVRKYSPRELEDRVEEDRLSKADLIEVIAVGPECDAVVRLSGRHGEPGADLTTSGCGDFLASQLRQAVELGDWRPWSAEKLAVVAFFTVTWSSGLIMVEVIGDPRTTIVGWLLTLLLAGLYLWLTRAVVTSLMPPLEIRPAGSTAARSIIAWFFPGLPAIVAIAGLVLAISK